MSTRCSGDAKRSFINGMRLWPPARTLASGPWSDSRPNASSSDEGQWYWNAVGSITNLLQVDCPMGNGAAKGNADASEQAGRASSWTPRRGSHSWSPVTPLGEGAAPGRIIEPGSRAEQVERLTHV